MDANLQKQIQFAINYQRNELKMTDIEIFEVLKKAYDPKKVKLVLWAKAVEK